MTWNRPEYEAVARLVRERTGLTLADRESAAEEAIARALARQGGPGMAAVEGLGADADAFDELVSDLTIGETYFFRDAAQFDVIRDVVLPEVRQRRGHDHAVRAWSAGCASGEEAYSLAMLFAEQGLAERSSVLATDVSRRALAVAKRGVYGAWSLREGGKRALPNLTPQGKHYHLADALKRRVVVRASNLVTDTFPAPADGICDMDLILCRNVLIYFDHATVSQVARKLTQTLTPGGWLITAASDPPLWDEPGLESVNTTASICYRRPLHEGVAVPRHEVPVDAVPLPIRLALAEDSARGNDENVQVSTEVSARVEHARLAYDRGDYEEALVLTAELLHDQDAAVWHLRALANLDVPKAVAVCADLVSRQPSSARLRFLHAILLLNQGCGDDAIVELRRAAYLDRTLAIAQFALGTILERRGDVTGACRAYRNARDLCQALPADQEVPLAEGETAERLAASAGACLACLETQGGAP